MGQAKTEMTKTDKPTPAPEKPKGSKPKSWGWFSRKKFEEPAKDPGETAEKFVEHLDVCREKIDELIAVKEKDVQNEGDSEKAKNELKVSILKSMRSDLDSLDERADLYSKI